MRINMEDMRYYLDPIQRTTFNTTDRNGVKMTEFTIIPLRYRRTDLNERKANLLGKPMTVSFQRHEQNEIWWVDADGDHVQGAVMVPRADGRMLSAGIIDDETFAVGTHGGMYGTGSLLTNARRSDGVRPFPHGSNRLITGDVMQAAPWALTMMPETGDTQDVVDQKVMLAKQKYDQRYKKGQVYIEGMIRDWLDLLSQVRDDGHDMPTPRFAIGASGVALVSVGRPATDDVSEQVRDATERVRNLPLTAGSRAPLTQYVGTPFVTVTSATVSTYQGLREYNANDVTAHIQQNLGYVDNVVEQSRFPILVNF